LRPSPSSALAFAALLAGCGGASSEQASTTAEPARPERVAVALRFEDAGVDVATDTPHTRVVLAVIRESDGRTETHEVGVVSGACNYVAPSAAALAAGSCWWAGSGDNFELARRGAELVVSRVQVDEELTAPLAPEPVLRVELPERAQVQVIVPELLR
jgi:hypothetical protein